MDLGDDDGHEFDRIKGLHTGRNSRKRVEYYKHEGV